MTYNEAGTLKQLSALDAPHRAAFAAACTERMLPAFSIFSRTELWGDPGVLRAHMDTVWKWLSSQRTPAGGFDRLADACMLQVPDSDEHVCDFTEYAQRAAAAVIYTLQCCSGGDVKVAVLPARLATETVDIWAQGLSDDHRAGPESLRPLRGLPTAQILEITRRWQRQTDVDADAQPAMIAEVFRQQQDLESLRKATSLTSEFVQEFRRPSISVPVVPFEHP